MQVQVPTMALQAPTRPGRVFVHENTFGLTSDFVLQYSIEASTLGLKPGEVPNQIETSMGNKQNFALLSADPQVFIYRQIGGCLTLKIFND